MMSACEGLASKKSAFQNLYNLIFTTAAWDMHFLNEETETVKLGNLPRVTQMNWVLSSF